MFCGHCGSILSEKAIYCPKCGAKVFIPERDTLEDTAQESVNRKEPGTSASNDQLEEESCNIILAKVGTDKTRIVKALCVYAGLGLTESKELVAQVPVIFRKSVTLKEAETIKTALVKEGAEVTFTDREGHNVEISLRCRTCGAVLDNGSKICKFCGNDYDFLRSCKICSLENNSTMPNNTIGQRQNCSSNTKGKWRKQLDNLQDEAIWGKCFIGIAALAALIVIGLFIWLLISLLRWIFSSFILVVAAAAGGYFLYHWGIAELITERAYQKSSRALQLPQGMSASMLLEALSGKFNYPNFKGVHYGANGECVIEGKYSMYPVVFGANGIAEIDYIAKENEKRKRTILLEAMTIRDYINKFFHPNLPVDVLKDMKKLRLAEGQRKAVAFVSAAASILITVAIAFYFIHPDNLLNMVVPGLEVRSAYLSEYSQKVTIEEAFKNFFDNCKWTKYDSDGYTNIAFTGTCEYLGERADIRIIFKITGENFIVDRLEINGRTQSYLILYGLLSKVYENYTY